MRDELEAYGAGLDDKPEVIALNKSDTIDDELADGAGGRAARPRPGARVFPVSGATGAGVEAVLDALVGHIGRIAAEAAAAEEGDWSPL